MCWCNNTVLLAQSYFLGVWGWKLPSLSPFLKIYGFSKLNPWTSSLSLTHSWHSLTLWNLLIQSRMWCREWWVFRLFVDRNVTCWKWICTMYSVVFKWCSMKLRASEKILKSLVNELNLTVPYIYIYTVLNVPR